MSEEFVRLCPDCLTVVEFSQFLPTTKCRCCLRVLDKTQALTARAVCIVCELESGKKMSEILPTVLKRCEVHKEVRL